ncbi:MAG: type IV pilus secretin PilQ [Desulfobacterales bacterium]|nr:type IV pilus secretin PilQ [Desulfobacterales bacterium]
MCPLAFSHNKFKLFLLSPLLVLLALLFSNCAASNPGQVDPSGPESGAVERKQINTLAVAAEDDQKTTLTIGGSTGLLFSDIRKTAPPTVSFYFPGTELVDIQDLYQVDAPPIKDIHTSEVVADGHTAKITVNLLQDADYSVEQDENGITVSFARDVLIEENELPAENTAAEDNQPALTSETIDPAILEAASKGTCIEMVDLKEQSDGVEISILADGTITDYSAFTVDNPPRIVFDIYEINSPYKGLQKIEVESKWVKGVRHFCYPEKLRVVLDTDRSYLTSFTSKPIKNGLLISVTETKPLLDDALVQTVAADTTAPASPAPQMAEAVIIDETQDLAPAAEMQPVIELAAAHETPEPPLQEDQGAIQSEGAASDTESQPAWLNKLEFTSVEEGASLVSIGTTNPVRYDMARISDRKLQLKLFNTRIPQYRKRPLITTRFKSAVDRITPIETAPTDDHALVVFELREGVPFEIAQVDNFINIRFAASSVPPKPLEETSAPEWKQALEGKAEEVEAAVVDKEAPMKADQADDSGPADPIGALASAQQDGRVEGEELRPPKTYTGEKIALNFFDTDIRNVFRIIGEISGENFAIDKNVSGKVTLQFDKPVPWDQVLELVLRMNQLGLRKEDGIFRIATQATLAREEQLEQQKLESQRSAEEQQELVTEFFLLSYIDAQETACAHLAAQCDNTSGNQVGWPSKFSPRGSVSVDTKKNMIIVNEIPSAIERARTIIRMLDQVTPQVLIESRIVEASSDFRRDVGFDWGTVAIGQFDLGDAFTVTGIDFEGDNIPSDALDNGAIEWGLSKISGTSFDIIDARIQVGETEGKTRTISAPKILTLDGRTARIQQGFQIPYLERDSAGGSSVEFQDVDLELSVTPNVTPDKRVLLVVDIKKDDVLDVTAAQPPLSTNSAHTELLMENGETVVIGGVMKANTSEAGEGIPGLRKIPALGFFFGFSNKNDNQTELLIFLTPEIVQLAQREMSPTNLAETP